MADSKENYLFDLESERVNTFPASHFLDIKSLP